jgi:hypothetical protein
MGVSGVEQRLTRLAWWVGAMVLVALAGVGCSDGKKKVYPVKGRVVDAEGKPAVGAVVILRDVSVADEGPNRPTGRVGEDGEFRLTYYTEGDGAPEGEYAVTLIWPTPRKSPFEPEGNDRYAGKFASPQSPLTRFRVERSPANEIPLIQLP